MYTPYDFIIHLPLVFYSKFLIPFLIQQIQKKVPIFSNESNVFVKKLNVKIF